MTPPPSPVPRGPRKPPNKLKKAPPPGALSIALDEQPLVLISPFPPTPEPTPPKDEKPKKALFGLGRRGKPLVDTTQLGGLGDEATSTRSEGAEWVDHTAYFPAYEPVAPTLVPLPTADFNTKMARSNPYYPDYEPVYPAVQAGGARAYALAFDHAQMADRAARMGLHAVQWPELPAFSTYTGAGAGADKDKDKAKTGWRTAPWGTEGWTGFGWEGEKIPNAQGQTFSAPMPKGEPVLIEEEKGGGKKKKNKKKNKKDGDGDGEDGEEDEEAPGDEA